MKNAQISAISAITFTISLVFYFFDKDVGYTISITGLALISLMTMNL